MINKKPDYLPRLKDFKPFQFNYLNRNEEAIKNRDTRETVTGILIDFGYNLSCIFAPLAITLYAFPEPIGKGIANIQSYLESLL